MVAVFYRAGEQEPDQDCAAGEANQIGEEIVAARAPEGLKLLDRFQPAIAAEKVRAGEERCRDGGGSEEDDGAGD